MKWFPLHIGDWTSATSGLTPAQKGIYFALLVWMYDHECKLPLSEVACRVIAGARGRYDCEDLKHVLYGCRFFEPTEHGFTHHVVEERLARAGLPLRDAASSTAAASRVTPSRDASAARGDASRCARHAARQKRYRDRVKEKIQDALDAARRPMTEVVVHEVVEAVTVLNHEASRDAQRDGGTRARNSEGIRDIQLASLAGRAHVGGGGVTPTAAGAACLAMRLAGLASVNPSHPELLRLLDEGMTVDELVEAAREAVARGKGMAYAMATARGRRRDAAAADALPAKVDPLEQLVGPLFLAKVRGGVS